jgi:cytochrome b
VVVWDLPVRVFHWALVACVVVCAFTGFLGPRNELNLHLAAGSAIAALVAFRVLWGWTGSVYARFASFAPSVSAALAHLIAIRAGRRERHLGHNPLGALMVYALLIVLAAIVATGAFALGGVVKQGPLAFIVSYAVGSPARQTHELLAVVLLGLVGAHLVGTAFESYRSDQNLVRAMITGRKLAGDGAVPGRGARVGLAVVATAGSVAVAVPAIVWLSSFPAAGVPRSPVDPTYAQECGACHFAYPPSLAPAAVWGGLMDHLDSHFGEDASVDPATAAKLRLWLEENAAERWDTRAAHLFRVRDPAAPMRITLTPAWTHIHRVIPVAVFAARAVGAKGACDACHHDAASGRFDPQKIAIPEGAER